MTTLRRIQFATVLAHSAYVLWAAAMVSANAGAAMYQAPWFPLFLLDFPATVVLILSWVCLPEALFKWGVETGIDIASLWLPLLLYGVIGTWLWWKMPIAFSRKE